MEQDKNMVLQREEDLKDTIENELVKAHKENQIEIQNIKPVGQIETRDKINGKIIKEDVFLVECVEKNSDGKIINKTEKYYLKDKCIGAKIKEQNGEWTEMLYAESFKNSEPEKVKAINELLEKTSEKEMDNLSLNNLKGEEQNELQAVLSAYLGKDISKEQITEELKKMDTKDVENLRDEKKNEKDGKDIKLNEKQTEKVSINAIQSVSLNQKVDGKETLGTRLDLPEYDKIYVIYADKVNNVTPNSKIRNTEYALVGVKKDGTAKVLNEEFELDNAIGSANVEQTKIRADSTATRDNKTISNYVRKTNKMSIGIEREESGVINLFLNEKTKEENENVGIQIETSQTQRVALQAREIMNRSKGEYQQDKVRNEIKEHTDAGCKPKNVEDFDGDEYTETHEHPETTKENIQEEKDKYLNNKYASQYEETNNKKEKTEEKEIEDLYNEDRIYADFINKQYKNNNNNNN